MDQKFKVGELVRKIHQKEIIGEVVKFNIVQAQVAYQIRLQNNEVVTLFENSLERYLGAMDVRDYFISGSFSNKDSFVRLSTFNKLAGGFTSNPTSLKSSRTIFNPYQYKPLLKFLLTNYRRLLIADEVGLGKTIEAGHIILEMNARKNLKNFLVVCPKSLVFKWRNELYDKFYFETEIIGSKEFLNYLDDYELGRFRGIKGIISYQTIRSRVIINRLKEVNPEFDMIIFDEMHWARNETSLTHRLVRQISEFSDSVIGLTATPIMIGSTNLYNLLRILNPAEFPNEYDFNLRLRDNEPIVKAIYHVGKKDFNEALNELDKLNDVVSKSEYFDSFLFNEIKQRLIENNTENSHVIRLLKDLTEFNLLSHIITRTRRRDVEVKTKRDPHIKKIQFSNIELSFYKLVTSHIRKKYNLIGKQKGINFALIMPQRQVASCINVALEIFLSKPDFTEYIDEIQNGEFEEFDRENNNNEQEESNTNFSEFNSGLKELASSFVNLREMPDSKFNAFIEIIEESLKSNSESKILVFSFFKGTISYLFKKLKEQSYQAYLISGQVSNEERNDILRKFRENNDIRILLSTEVGSEGLDFEFCNVLINYDLPWNPMVVEQRIGRLDRIGQKFNRIKIFNFSVSETIESLMLERLYERIEIFKNSIGDLESILGEEINELTKDLFSQELSIEEEEERIERTSRIIEQRIHDAKSLEDESPGLLTYDEYFKQELESILTERRYVTDTELFIYVKEFLRSNFPESIIRDTENEYEKNLKVSEKLLFEIKKFLQASGLLNEIFFDFEKAIINSDNRDVKVTFNSDEAFKNKSLVYINNFHPLILFISTHYSSDLEKIFPVSSIVISYHGLEMGAHFYFTYIFESLGIQKRKYMKTFFIDSNLNEVAKDSDGARLVAFLIDNGHDQDPKELRISVGFRELIEKADNLALNYQLEMETELVHKNEVYLNKQKQIIERTINNQINRLNSTINEVKADLKRSKIIPALEGKIKKLEENKEIALLDLTTKQNVDVQSKLIAAGVINNLGGV